MARLSNEEINAIAKKTSIVDIIGSYLSLEKKGKNYFGICPFHDDHTPSMSVNEEKGIYTCFVCHKTGNVFNFVQEYENISFLEAVKEVANKTGIELNIEFQTTSKYDTYYNALDLASKFYQNHLKSKEGKKARAYLEERGLSEVIIEEFEIGYAPSEFDTITKLLLNKSFDEELLINAGISGRGNSLYDLFRNRITFPIHNAQGKSVGFSARIFDNSNDAKYINTKETPVFKKGEILFNYHRAQNEAKRKKVLIIVEGQMDAIRVYASGIKNVVATMGTALTNDHVKLLKRLNVKVVLCMDNDKAGEQATIQNGELLSKNEIDLGILRIEDAKDPDEYILKHKKEAFLDAVANAITFFDFKMNYLKKDKNLEKVDDVSLYINQVIKELNKTNDDVLINLTINKLSEEYGVSKNVLYDKVIKVESTPKISITKFQKKKQNKDEMCCALMLYYMMNDTKYIEFYEQEISFVPMERYEKIANELLAFFLKYNYINIADFITYEIESDHYEDVLDIIDRNANIELSDAEFVGLIERMKILNTEKKIEELKQQLKLASDINEKSKIIDEIANMKKRMCKE